MKKWSRYWRSAKLPIKPKDNGVVLCLRVQPNASRNRLIVEDDGRIRLAITAPAVEGKANKALIAVLSKMFHVPKRVITIISGESSREKRVFIDDIDLETVSSVVQQLS